MLTRNDNNENYENEFNLEHEFDLRVFIIIVLQIPCIPWNAEGFLCWNGENTIDPTKIHELRRETLTFGDSAGDRILIYSWISCYRWIKNTNRKEREWISAENLIWVFWSSCYTLQGVVYNDFWIYIILYITIYNIDCEFVSRKLNTVNLVEDSRKWWKLLKKFLIKRLYKN